MGPEIRKVWVLNTPENACQARPIGKIFDDFKHLND